MLLAVAIVALLAALILATGNVRAGDPDGGGHGIIRILLP
jgi:hypothetical protein